MSLSIRSANSLLRTSELTATNTGSASPKRTGECTPIGKCIFIFLRKNVALATGRNKIIFKVFCFYFLVNVYFYLLFLIYLVLIILALQLLSKEKCCLKVFKNIFLILFFFLYSININLKSSNIFFNFKINV